MTEKMTETQNGSEKLIVLWTSRDKDVAERMVFMYTLNSKLRGWWKDVTLIIWGSSAQLTIEDEEITHAIKKLIEAGVKVEACKACTDSYGASEALIELGVDVKYMGIPFTEYLKTDEKILTI